MSDANDPVVSCIAGNGQALCETSRAGKPPQKVVMRPATVSFAVGCCSELIVIGHRYVTPSAVVGATMLTVSLTCLFGLDGRERERQDPFLNSVV